MEKIILLKEFVKRDIKARYVGSVGGIIWPFIHPVGNFLLFYFLFALILKIQIDPTIEGTSNFSLFLFTALIPWFSFSEAITRSTNVLIENSNIIKNNPLDPKILILTVNFSALFHQLIATGIFLVFLYFISPPRVLNLLLLPFILIIQITISTGCSLAVAMLQTVIRDTYQIVQIVLQVIFYMTPIVYPLTFVPEKLQTLLQLNPLTSLIEIYRFCLLGKPIPILQPISTLAIYSFLILLLGYSIFQRGADILRDQL